MTSVYISIGIIGLTVILLLTLLSDLVDSIFDFLWATFMIEHIPLINPVSFFTGLTVFGTVGYLLTRFSQYNNLMVFVFAIGFAIFSIVALYYLIVKPKEASETSLAFSMKQVIGLQAIVSIPIPADGFGEVLIKLGGGNSNQIAASFDRVDISQDDKVFIVDVKDGVVYVSLLTI